MRIMTEIEKDPQLLHFNHNEDMKENHVKLEIFILKKVFQEKL